MKEVKPQAACTKCGKPLSSVRICDQCVSEMFKPKDGWR